MVKSGDNYVGKETYVSERNKTQTPLVDGASYTGDWERVGDKTSVVVRVTSDQKCQYFVEFSPDKTLITSSIPLFFDPARINTPNRFTIGDDYFRIRVVNTSGNNMTQLFACVLVGVKELLNFPLDGVLSQKADSIVTRSIRYEDEVVLGLREGKIAIREFGSNPDVDSGSPELVAPWGGSLVVVPSAETLDIVSDSANDTNGGTGAHRVFIDGIDSNYDRITETINLNGLTAVSTANSYRFINYISVDFSGTNKSNVGTITATFNTTGNIGGQLLPNRGTTTQAMYQIPRNFEGCLQCVFYNVVKVAGGSAPNITFNINVLDVDKNTIYQEFPLRVDTNINNDRELFFNTPLRIPEKAILFITVETDTNNTIANFTIRGIAYQKSNIVV